MIRIDPHRLMRLAVLINEGSFRKAADKLGLTQPALSQSIAQMEDEVGVQLITRSARGVEPTIYGEALYRHAKAIDSELTNAAQQIQNLVIGSAGFLLAGAVAGGGIHIVAQAAARLMKTRPSAKIVVTEEVLASALLKQLHDRNIDVVISQRLSSSETRSVRAIRLLKTRKVLCVRKGHPLEGCDDIKRFLDYPFICPPGEMGILSEIKSIFAESGLTVPSNDIVVSNSISFAKECIMTSDAFSIFSNISVRKERESNQIVCADLPDDGTWYYLLTRKEYVATDLVKAFIREIFAVCDGWGLPVHNDARHFESFGRSPTDVSATS